MGERGSRKRFMNNNSLSIFRVSSNGEDIIYIDKQRNQQKKSIFYVIILIVINQMTSLQYESLGIVFNNLNINLSFPNN